MIGWHNPCPMTCGGGPSDIEVMWQALRTLVDAAHTSKEDGFEDSARQQDAIVLAGCERAIERAFFSAFPRIAEDALPLWQKLLRSQGVDELDLRELLAAAWQAPHASTTPNLATDLAAISSKLSIVLEDEDGSTTTIPGKVWAPTDPSAPTFGPRAGAIFPGYTSRDILRVRYTLDDDVPEVAIPDPVQRAVTVLLQHALPAHQTWLLTSYSASTDGVLRCDGGDHGESVLDFTGLA